MSENLSGILAEITYGKRVTPIRVCIYGPDGIGKTTFASQAPSPIFIGTESGTYQLDVARLPQPESLGAFLQQIDAIRDSEHPFKTVVVDSLDWLEPLIHRQVCAEGGVKSIEQYEKGYGKGYVRALEIWRGIIDRLAELGARYHIILVAHGRIKKFDDPEQPAGYDRWILAIHENAAAAIRQACDCVLFANYKTVVKNINSAGTGRGIGSAERRMYTECRPAFDAKNRYRLPFEMPLSWPAFGQAVKSFYNGDGKPPETVLASGNVETAQSDQTPPESNLEPGPVA